MSGDSVGYAQAPDPALIVAALGVVPGIGSARVIPGDPGCPDRLRLEPDPGADLIEIIRAVQRILRLQFGVGLEPESGPHFDTEVLASAARHPAGITCEEDARAPGRAATVGVRGLWLRVDLSIDLGALVSVVPDAPVCRRTSNGPRLVPPLPL